MIILANTISSRLRYTADFIGNELFGQPFWLTISPGDYKRYEGIKINYTNERVSENEFWIKPHALLFETGIRQQDLDIFDHKGYPAFFKTDGQTGFDIFAAVFYLITRYEEYLPHERDDYGRFAHTNSIAFRNGFLGIPLVNIWLRDLAASLNDGSPSEKRRGAFNFIPTYDIDEAYSFRHKGELRTVGGAVKSVLKGKMDVLLKRWSVLRGSSNDPYDAFEWMNDLNARYGLQPYYFFLVAKRTGKYDRHILPTEKKMHELILKHSEKYHVGLHPSWQSGDNLSLLKEEFNTLSSIIRKRVDSSRQHYIRMELPLTYRRLIETGIVKDFSMGYGSINGFRASVASPFYWYDLERETGTTLLVYPFCYMEANSFYEQKLNADQALEEMTHYYKQVKAVDGTLIMIWHNTFLGTDEKFKGWREAYEKFVAGVR